MNLRITCDFDGTITTKDTVNALLAAYALPAWLDIEEEWCAGRIGSRECLAKQTELLRLRPEVLDAYLDAVETDPMAAAFFAACAARGYAVSVVSDGYDWAIRRVLAKAGVKGAPIVANRLVHRGDDRWVVRFPFSAPGCGSGVCKCRASEARQLRVHIGDGRSDFCAAEHADLVFAKGQLLDHMTSLGIAVVPFSTFSDIIDRLDHVPAMLEAAAAASQRTA